MAEYLFIYDGEETHLPSDFHFSHNFCVRLYDELAGLLVGNEMIKSHKYTLKFKNKEDAPPKHEGDILKWLADKGYNKELDELVSRNLSFALLSDMCHFIYQALMSSKKMKLTVAFHLLRKPFLENLIILEELFTDEKTFLRKFELDPSKFDPGKLSDDDKRKLITQSINKVHKNFALSEELIYTIRHDKKNNNSIYANANLATHLVTTRHSSFSTESQNLNFIFSGYEEWDSQLGYIYQFLPHLLYYTATIVDEYYFHKKLISRANYESRKFYRLIGLLIHQDQFDVKAAKGKSSLNSLLKSMKVKCKNCEKPNSLFRGDLYSLVQHDYILCKYCLADLKHETNSFQPIISKLMK